MIDRFEALAQLKELGVDTNDSIWHELSERQLEHMRNSIMMNRAKYIKAQHDYGMKTAAHKTMKEDSMRSCPFCGKVFRQEELEENN